MLCNSEEKDPRKCINEGKEVTRCGLEFFQKVKNQCAQEFTQYWKCLDKSGDNMHFKRSDIVMPLYVVMSKRNNTVESGELMCKLNSFLYFIFVTSIQRGGTIKLVITTGLVIDPH